MFYHLSICFIIFQFQNALYFLFQVFLTFSTVQATSGVKKVACIHRKNVRIVLLVCSPNSRALVIQPKLPVASCHLLIRRRPSRAASVELLSMTLESWTKSMMPNCRWH